MRSVVSALKWLIFLTRYALYAVYSCIQFVSKPGTRVLFPVALLAVSFWQRDQIETFFKGFAQGLFGSQDSGPIFAVVLGSVVIAIVGFAYVLVSKTVAVVLGTFPPITRPLKPLKDLRAAKPAPVSPVAVRVVVPPLPRRR